MARHVRRHPGTRVSLLTNGWFLEARDFLAAGRRYAPEADYLRDLSDSGVTHLTFSLDGPADVHHRWRGATKLGSSRGSVPHAGERGDQADQRQGGDSPPATEAAPAESPLDPFDHA